MSNPIRSRTPAFAVALIIASVGAACSNSGGTSDSTTASAGPTTEAAATTPSPTTATTAAPTVEDAIRAAHTRVMTELFARDERVMGPEAMLPLAEQLTTGPLLQRIKDDIKSKQTTGERSVNPGYDSHIVRVSVLAVGHAQVLDCSQDRGERFAADGVLLIPADDFYKLRTSDMVQVDGRWLASDIFVGGDERCDPAA